MDRKDHDPMDDVVAADNRELLYRYKGQIVNPFIILKWHHLRKNFYTTLSSSMPPVARPYVYLKSVATN